MLKSQEVAKKSCDVAKKCLTGPHPWNYNFFNMKCKKEISFKKLWVLLIEKNIAPADLRKDLNIATGTMTKLRRNEEVAMSVLLRICEYLDCNISDICDAVNIDEESEK